MKFSATIFSMDPEFGVQRVGIEVKYGIYGVNYKSLIIDSEALSLIKNHLFKE